MEKTVWFSLCSITVQELVVYSSHDSLQAKDLAVNSTFLLFTEVNLVLSSAEGWKWRQNFSICHSLYGIGNELYQLPVPLHFVLKAALQMSMVTQNRSKKSSFLQASYLVVWLGHLVAFVTKLLHGCKINCWLQACSSMRKAYSVTGNFCK